MPATETSRLQPNSRKKSRTEEFRAEEARLKEPCQELFEEIKQMIERRDLEAARERLNSSPFDLYEYALEKEDPPNKVRDCLYALVRWVFRSVEIQPNRSFASDVKYLEDTMKRKCNYC